MRIAILSELFPPSTGGQAIRFAELAEVLVQQGHSVDVFCLAHDATVPANENPSPGLTITRPPRVSSYHMPAINLLPRSLTGMVRYAIAARSWLAQGQFDAIIMDQWPLLHVLAIRSRDRRRAVIDWCEVRPGLAYRLFQGLLPRLSAANIAVSEEVQAHIAARSGGPVMLMPSGIMPGCYGAGIPSSRSGLLYIGRLAHYEGIPLLVAAFNELRRRGHACTLTIAGEGPAWVAVQAAITASPYVTDIDLLGEISEEQKRSLLANSKVLVLPGQREGFPRVVAEAMASALPIVTADYPGNGTVGVLRQAGCGVSANPTATDIANGVEAVLSDWDRYSQLAALAAERLDWRQLAAELAPFLYAAANRPARPQRIAEPALSITT